MVAAVYPPLPSTSAAPIPPSSQQPHHQYSDGQELAAKLTFGGLSCMLSSYITNPVDMIKSRLQLQGEPTMATASGLQQQSGTTLTGMRNVQLPSGSSSGGIPGQSLKSSLGLMQKSSVSSVTFPQQQILQQQPPKAMRLFPLVRHILATEGPSAFMAGAAASVLRESIYSTIRVGTYDLFKGLYSGHGTSLRGGEETTTMVKLLAGLTSGALGSAIANPTDLIKIRLQAYSPTGKPRYASIHEAFQSIYRQEGIAGLYRGVIPTASRAMILTASQLASYDSTKHWLLRLETGQQGNNVFHEGFVVHLVASMTAGMACSLTTAPIDVVKVRYMNQQFNAQGVGSLYKSTIDCLFKTVSREGPMALYKGFWPCFFRLGPHTVMSFLLYENMRSAFGLNPV